MKDADQAPAWRMYPHVVTRVGARDVRHDIHITNEPLDEDRAGWHAAQAFARPGAIDDRGQVTAIGRAAIVDGVRGRLAPGDERCVVWGPRSCTWVSREATIEGVDPPDGDPSDLNAFARMTPTCPDGVWIALPAGAAASHIFVRRLTFDRVEVATAAPLVIARWDEPVRAGEPDPFADWFAPDGTFVPKSYYQGMEVTGVYGGDLLGPVQPDGKAFRVVRPWPSTVRAACIELAGRPLPSSTTLAVWREVEQMEHGPIICGSRRAA